MQKFEEKQHAHTSMVSVLSSLLNCRQGPEQKVTDYIDRIRTIAETIEHHGGSIGDLYYSAVLATAPNGTDRSADERKRLSRNLFLASLCVQNADRARFGTLVAHLANQFLLGRDEYPVDLTEAQGLLNNYQTPTNKQRSGPAAPVVPRNPVTSGTTFAQATAAGPRSSWL
jgi:hypothetical protein